MSRDGYLNGAREDDDMHGKFSMNISDLEERRRRRSLVSSLMVSGLMASGSSRMVGGLRSNGTAFNPVAVLTTSNS